MSWHFLQYIETTTTSRQNALRMSTKFNIWSAFYFRKFKNCKTDAVIIRILTDVSAMLPSSGYTEEGSIAETSVKILIITASVLQFLNLHSVLRCAGFSIFLFPVKCMFLSTRPKKNVKLWSRKKRSFSGQRKCHFCKVEEMGIFQRGYLMVLVKNFKIFSSLFFSEIGLEIMLKCGLKRNKALKVDKNVSLLKLTKWVFFKGVNPWFQSKNPKFFLVFSCKIGLKIMLTCGLERKEAFYVDKDVNSEKSKK